MLLLSSSPVLTLATRVIRRRGVGDPLEERRKHEHEPPRSPYFNTCVLAVAGCLTLAARCAPNKALRVQDAPDPPAVQLRSRVPLRLPPPSRGRLTPRPQAAQREPRGYHQDL